MSAQRVLRQREPDLTCRRRPRLNTSGGSVAPPDVGSAPPLYRVRDLLATTTITSKYNGGQPDYFYFCFFLMLGFSFL